MKIIDPRDPTITCPVIGYDHSECLDTKSCLVDTLDLPVTGNFVHPIVIF